MSEPAPDDRLGKYEVRGTLGRGAMGIVYDGWDPAIDRRVAIKTVRLPDASDADATEALARFKREAQAAGRLHHPNIVGVFDYGETGEVAYIVMEFVDGRTLKQLLEADERLPLARTVQVMEDVLRGLAYSHERGVVHRDIKPANIMLTREGQAKIADFGIARIESSSMTQVGTVLGTPAYMSPEQFMGQTVDSRTDIYSCGVLLYQLLTGERPFEGSLTAIMHKVLNASPPRPSDLSVVAPPGLDAVVARAMARRPDDRFTDAGEFVRALQTGAAANAPVIADPLADPLADAAPVDAAPVDATMVMSRAPAPRASAAPRRATPPPPPPQSGGRLGLMAGGGLSLLAIAAFGAWILTRPSPPSLVPASVPDTPVPAGAPAPVAMASTSVLPASPAASEPPAVSQAAPAAPAEPPVTTPPVVQQSVVPPPAAPSPIAGQPTTPEPSPPTAAPQLAAAPPTAEASVAPSAPAPTTAATAPAPEASVQSVDRQTEWPRTGCPPRCGNGAAALSPPTEIAAAEPAVHPVVPEPQVTPIAASQPTAAMRAALAAALTSLPCTLASADTAASGDVGLAGLAGAGEPEAALRRAATNVADWHVATFKGPYCGALDVLRPVAGRAAAAAARLQLTLASGGEVLQENDLLKLAITLPDFAGHLQVDYLQQDGTVGHLSPSAAYPDRTYGAHEHAVLGQPRSDFAGWPVGAPFGTDMIVALVSTAPLFATPRPDNETIDNYMRAVQAAMENLRRRGGKVAADAMVLETKP